MKYIPTSTEKCPRDRAQQTASECTGQPFPVEKELQIGFHDPTAVGSWKPICNFIGLCTEADGEHFRSTSSARFSRERLRHSKTPEKRTRHGETNGVEHPSRSTRQEPSPQPDAPGSSPSPAAPHPSTAPARSPARGRGAPPRSVGGGHPPPPACTRPAPRRAGGAAGRAATRRGSPRVRRAARRRPRGRPVGRRSAGSRAGRPPQTVAAPSGAVTRGSRQRRRLWRRWPAGGDRRGQPPRGSRVPAPSRRAGGGTGRPPSLWRRRRAASPPRPRAHHRPARTRPPATRDDGVAAAPRHRPVAAAPTPRRVRVPPPPAGGRAPLGPEAGKPPARGGATTPIAAPAAAAVALPRRRQRRLLDRGRQIIWLSPRSGNRATARVTGARG